MCSSDLDFASHRMQWFSYLSWAYEESGNWSALIALEGLPIAVPKEDDRQWVIYRFARAHEEVGNPARALELFDSAFPAVVHPWQRVARGRMLLASERHDEAVLEARRALASTSTDDLLLTIDAFHVIAKALSTSDRERALAHAGIAVAMRQRKGYGTDAKLRETFARLGVSDVPPADEAKIGRAHV